MNEEYKKYDGLKKVMNDIRNIPEWVFIQKFKIGPLGFRPIYEHGGFEVVIMELDNNSIIYDRLESNGKVYGDTLRKYTKEYNTILKRSDTGKGNIVLINDLLKEPEINALEEIFIALKEEWKKYVDIKNGIQLQLG